MKLPAGVLQDLSDKSTLVQVMVSSGEKRLLKPMPADIQGPDSI